MNEQDLSKIVEQVNAAREEIHKGIIGQYEVVDLFPCGVHLFNYF